MNGTLRLATTTTTFRRAVSLGGDGTAYITTWLAVEEDDEESGKPKHFTLPVVLSYAPDGPVRLHGPAAHLSVLPPRSPKASVPTLHAHRHRLHTGTYS